MGGDTWDTAKDWKDYIRVVLQNLMKCFPQTDLPDFFSANRMEVGLANLLFEMLDRVNQETGMAIKWINRERIFHLMSAEKSLPIPFVMKQEGNLSEHDYFVVGNHNLALFNRSGKRVTIKSDLQMAFGAWNKTIGYESIPGARLREISHAIMPTFAVGELVTASS